MEIETNNINNTNSKEEEEKESLSKLKNVVYRWDEENKNNQTYKRVVSPYYQNNGIFHINTIYELNYLLQNLKRECKFLTKQEIKTLFNNNFIQVSAKKIFIKLKQLTSVKYNLKHPSLGFKKVMGIKSLNDIILIDAVKSFMDGFKLHLAKAISGGALKTLIFNISNGNLTGLFSLLQINEVVFPLLIAFLTAVI